MGKIFIADDEKNIRDLLGRFLEDAGHKVRLFSNANDLLSVFENEIPDTNKASINIDFFTFPPKIYSWCISTKFYLIRTDLYFNYFI